MFFCKFLDFTAQKEWVENGFFYFVRLTPNQILRDFDKEDKPHNPSWQKLNLSGKLPPKPDWRVLSRILQELTLEGIIRQDPVQYSQNPMDFTYVSNEHIPMRQ